MIICKYHFDRNIRSKVHSFHTTPIYFYIFQIENPVSFFFVVGPHVYHEGFNLGENLGEAFNFGTEDWFQFVDDYPHCNCEQGLIQIDLKPFYKDISSKQQSLGLRKRRNINYNEDFTREDDALKKYQATNPYKINQRRYQGEPFKGTSKFKRLERLLKYKNKQAMKQKS